MSQAAQKPDEYYTYADYLTWDDNMRWELIDGVAYAMSPAPTRRHQAIIGEMFGQLHEFLKGKPCKLYIAPFDVRLNPDDADDTVVQPDLVVVCDRSKLDDKGCKGAPDLVVEILSPSTSKHDSITKLNLYQESGVREYWIVDPDHQTVQAFDFAHGQVKGYCDTDTLPSVVLSGCEINLTEVFAE